MGVDEPVGVRYAREVGPGDSGMRISLRYRLPSGQLTDVLGVLESWADGVVRVRRSPGDVVSIAAEHVVATKRVPPAPPRR